MQYQVYDLKQCSNFLKEVNHFIIISEELVAKIFKFSDQLSAFWYLDDNKPQPIYHISICFYKITIYCSII